MPGRFFFGGRFAFILNSDAESRVCNRYFSSAVSISLVLGQNLINLASIERGTTVTFCTTTVLIRCATLWMTEGGDTAAPCRRAHPASQRDPV